jgi:hypothetical protein
MKDLTTNKPNVKALLEKESVGCYFIVVGTTDGTQLSDNLPIEISIKG